MSETHSFTIERFYESIKEGKLIAAKCNKCETLLLPPRAVCTKCRSTDFSWVELEKKGKLLSYTIIHVSPMQFQSIVPYIVGIVELKDGPRLPGMVRGVDPKKIRVGMDLRVDFDTSIQTQWPFWPRYFFRSP